MPPVNIKIYHIVHIDRLPDIITEGFIFSDTEVKKRSLPGEIIGISRIKERRLNLTLASYPDLRVGECVPFYFCPRSIMLYIIHKGNSPDIEYRGGQEEIVHLVSDLLITAKWADNNRLRWVFTDSNAGSRYFNDYADINYLDMIDWQAIRASQWFEPHIREKKQAEFLIEKHFPWGLINEIGVYSIHQLNRINDILTKLTENRPLARIRKAWYY